jgi:hypothetical protein
MLYHDTTFVGIDPTSAHKSFTYAALDRGLNLVALADGELEDVLSFLAGQKSALVAVNAPSAVNYGLVREKMKQEMLTPHQIRGAEFRLAEFELRQRGISVSGTPARPELCPAWMQSGFELYQKLKKMGFNTYPEKDAPHQMLETHPHACFCVLTGHVPLPKPTLEGRLQRQLILHDHGMRIKDPMDFFEEITRFKLIKGVLPLDLVFLPEQLDAMIAAYVAWMAHEKPGDVMRIGDGREGLITLPSQTLKEKY